MKKVKFSLSLLILSFLMSPVSAQNLTVESRKGLKCWVIKSNNIELSVTQKGGHMAPVTFFRNSRNPVSPYYISPWQMEGHKEFPAQVLVPLRGDFFCLPFGGNGDRHEGEKHEPHGETATSLWELKEVSTDQFGSSLAVQLKTHVRKGTVTKRLHINNDENVIYSTHTIENFAGKVPLGHHATLAMPEELETFHIFHSPIEFGMTNAGLFSNPENREYQQLAVGAEFSSLSAVPSIYQKADNLDVGKLPREKGFADLFQIIQKQGKKPAWVVALNTKDKWMWFSIKNQSLLTSTVFWLENGGRHGFPWNGRNNCVGIEDVTAFFAEGLVPSINENVLSKRGIRTSINLSSAKPTDIHYIQGVSRIPNGFDDVASVSFPDNGKVVFTSSEGVDVYAKARWQFVFDGRHN